MREEGRLIEITFDPDLRSVRVPEGTSVLDAAREAGILLQAACGGLGICDTCQVRFLGGNPDEVGTVERDALEEDELAAGYRLACQAVPVEDASIDIPARSRLKGQRLVVEGHLVAPEPEPSVSWTSFEISAPSVDDLQPDLERVLDTAGSRSGIVVPPPVAAEVSRDVRSHGRVGTLVLGRHGVAPVLVGLLARGDRPLGVAVDLGSTRLAGYLLDLTDGRLLAKGGAGNPQIPFGEDVVSRIAYANGGPEQAGRLRDDLLARVSTLIEDLAADAGVSTKSVVDAVFVGNSAMHHLFLGWPVRQLGEAPYVPISDQAFECRAGEIGLRLREGARCYFPPLVAGFVGSDHVAVQVALGLDDLQRSVLVLDIGTNTEVSLVKEGQIWSCSCASGPAFEGAHIRHGMRAGPGAVERVRFEDGAFRYETIGNTPAVGICGSGILDAVAAMRAAGLVTTSGRLLPSAVLREEADGRPLLVLVPAGEAAEGKEVVVTREDVHEVQLAKGAIRAGVDILLDAAGVRPDDLDRVILAGAFGSYLDPESITAIRMLPRFDRASIDQVGNAAGVGAVHMALTRSARRRAERIARDVRYIELTRQPQFPDVYLDALML